MSATVQELFEQSRKLPWIRGKHGHEWQEQLEHLIKTNGQAEWVESHIHHAFDGPRQRLSSIALFLAQFVLAPSDDSRNGPTPLQIKALKVLLTDYFSKDNENNWLEGVRRDEVLFRAIWDILAQDGYRVYLKPDERQERYASLLNKLVARLYYWTVNGLANTQIGQCQERIAERCSEVRPQVVEALRATEQLHLALKYRDTDPAMIRALNEFALTHGHLDYKILQRDPQNVREVMSFGYEHESQTLAATIAFVLQATRHDREELRRAKEQELAQLPR